MSRGDTVKLSIKMDKQGRIVIPKEVRNRLHKGQIFELDYIEDYLKSEPYNKKTCVDAIILEICKEKS